MGRDTCVTAEAAVCTMSLERGKQLVGDLGQARTAVTRPQEGRRPRWELRPGSASGCTAQSVCVLGPGPDLLEPLERFGFSRVCSVTDQSTGRSSSPPPHETARIERDRNSGPRTVPEGRAAPASGQRE